MINANIVNILMWTRPAKTSFVLVTINIILWFLTRQRPLGVLGLFGLLCYLRYVWKYRLRGEVLVDPPDHEDWVTLSSYDMHNAFTNYIASVTQSWLNFRQNSHLMWTVATCTLWLILAQIGTQVDFLTMLFLLCNAAFVIFPLMEVLPKHENSDPVMTPSTITASSVQQLSEPEEDQSDRWYSSISASISTPTFTTAQQQQIPSTTATQIEPSSSPSPPSSAALFPMSMSTPGALFSEFSDGIVSRTLSTAAVSLMNSSIFKTGMQQELRDGEEEESLTPAMANMPHHEEIDEEDSDDDEFHLDAHHFDKSSSSSVSNSFEIIDDES